MPQQTPSVARRGASKLAYDTYITSSKWERRKAKYYARHEKRCRACGSTEDIHLHHHTYKRLGKEHDNDLIPLCSEHHGAVHQLYDLHKGSPQHMSLTAATKQVVGGPLHPPRKRKRPPRGSVKRLPPQVISARAARRKALTKAVEPPSPRNPDRRFTEGERITVFAPNNTNLVWAHGKKGVVVQTWGSTASVELDGLPGSRLAVTDATVKGPTTRL